MQSLITIQTHTGTADIKAELITPAVAIHPPHVTNGTTKRKQWTLTVLPVGLSAGIYHGLKRDARKLATLWAAELATLTTETAKTWRFRRAWQLALSGGLAGLSPDEISKLPPSDWRENPELEESPTATAACLAARAGRPLDQSGGVPRIQWRGRWWSLPSDSELDWWTFDSCCETPDGRMVEPDHPESWLRILQLV